MKNFEWQVSHEGVSISLARKEKYFLKNKSSIIPVGEWSSEGDSTILTGLSAIAESIQSNEDDSVLSILLPHTRVSELNEQQAVALSLPPSVPYQLRVWSEGRMNDNTFQLQSEFLHLGNYVFVDSRIGSILQIGRLSYRIPSPLYDICEIVKNFPTGHDGKLEAISKLSALLGLDVTN